MTAGFTEIYECPTCALLILQPGSGSGSTVDAKYFSDGKREAPMLPAYPEITKCTSCDTIFWLSKTQSIGKYHPMFSGELPGGWEAAKRAQHLTLYEYNMAFEANRASADKDKLFLSKQIWWAFNDRTRRTEPLFCREEDEALWDRNMFRLLYLLGDEDENNRLLKAELYRNHGDFDRSLEILVTIRHQDLLKHRAAYECACRQQNKLVFELER
ncbi:hypothetical protein ACXYMU_14455 [Pontibacter sp. CAU 1760]